MPVRGLLPSDEALGARVKRVDILGRTFGHWTVMSEAGSSDLGQAMWNCKCVCGTRKRVRYNSLVEGKSKSCGCYGKGKPDPNVL